jgi:hypothetical protein
MIGHKLPNKTKSATVAEPKLFRQLNQPLICICKPEVLLATGTANEVNTTLKRTSKQYQLIALV